MVNRKNILSTNTYWKTYVIYFNSVCVFKFIFVLKNKASPF